MRGVRRTTCPCGAQVVKKARCLECCRRMDRERAAQRRRAGRTPRPVVTGVDTCLVCNAAPVSPSSRMGMCEPCRVRHHRRMAVQRVKIHHEKNRVKKPKPPVSIPRYSRPLSVPSAHKQKAAAAKTDIIIVPPGIQVKKFTLPSFRCPECRIDREFCSCLGASR